MCLGSASEPLLKSRLQVSAGARIHAGCHACASASGTDGFRSERGNFSKVAREMACVRECVHARRSSQLFRHINRADFSGMATVKPGVSHPGGTYCYVNLICDTSRRANGNLSASGYHEGERIRRKLNTLETRQPFRNVSTRRRCEHVPS